MSGSGSNGQPRYTLRPVTGADYDFLWQLHVATLREYVADTFGWDDTVQAAMFRERFDAVNSRIVVVGGCDAGVLIVERGPNELFLNKLQLLPELHGHGLGTTIIGDLLAEASRAGVPVGLQVLKVNPARRLYERLGFGVVSETATHYLMSTARGSRADTAQVAERGRER